MARTEKDRPYEIRAKEASKGIIKHHPYCNGLPHSWESYTSTKTHIFHANEVKEMDALREEVDEAGDEIKVIEKSGYLVSIDPNTYSDFLYKRPLRPHIREKVVADLSGPRGNNLYSSFDVFYIFEVSKTVDNKDERACCGATLPKALDRAECSCCKPYSKRQTKSRLRSELVAARKENYFGEGYSEEDIS